MIEMLYPSFDFRMKTENGKRFIFDNIRKIWLILTPEEWVRQNFIRYLTDVMQYPVTLIALEKQIKLGTLNKRFDILVYDSSHRPWMIVECKSMDISLTPSVLDQVLSYNLSVPVNYLVITNGKYCMPFEKLEGKLVLLEKIPIHTAK